MKPYIFGGAEIENMKKPNKPYNELKIWEKQQISAEFAKGMIAKCIKEKIRFPNSDKAEEMYQEFLSKLYAQPD